MADRLIKHDQSKKGLYKIWKGINDRCKNIKNPQYHNYGGRGITVCDRWSDADPISGFENFCNDMGIRPSSTHSTDRINNELGYSKENCRWATQKEQTNNTRRNSLVNLGDNITTVQLAAELLGMKPNTLTYRLRRGWNNEEALGFKDKQFNGITLKSGQEYRGKLTNEEFSKLEFWFYCGENFSKIPKLSGIDISESNLLRLYVRMGLLREELTFKDFKGEDVKLGYLRLNLHQIEEVKKLLLSGEKKYKIAEKMGVSGSCITDMCKKLKWGKYV